MDYDIPLAIAGVGLAFVSVYAWIKSKGEVGEGWGIIAFCCIICLKGCAG